MISNVFSLSFMSADHHHDFMILFAGHHVFNSIPAILFQYNCSILINAFNKETKYIVSYKESEERKKFKQKNKDYL